LPEQTSKFLIYLTVSCRHLILLMGMDLHALFLHLDNEYSVYSSSFFDTGRM